MKRRSIGYAAVLVTFAGLALALAAGLGDDPLAPFGVAQSRPLRRSSPSSKTLFGTKVTDNYRYMEALDATTTDWLKKQGACTRSILDAIKPRRGAFEAHCRLHRGFRLYSRLFDLRRQSLL